MALILENKAETEEDQLNKNEISALLRDNKEDFPLEKALVVSAVAHPAIPYLVWLFVFLLGFFGISIPLFQKPEIKPRDIEFVLVYNKEETPINKKTKLRAERNTRAGGKHDPTRKIVAPEKTSAVSKPSPQASQQQAKQASPPRPSKKTIQQHQKASPSKAPRPNINNTASAPPKITAQNPFSIEAPKLKAPKAYSPQGGAVTTAPIETYSNTGSPAPVMSSSSRSTASKGTRYSRGGGDMGNPGPGNSSGTPGIDAIKEPDFGPYRAELQRRIKRNWYPPRGNESKKVVLLFKVSRDGRLLSLNVQRSSGDPETDNAALQAVKLSSPFRPLPPEYRENAINIEFSFDYSVLPEARIRY